MSPENCIYSIQGVNDIFKGGKAKYDPKLIISQATLLGNHLAELFIIMQERILKWLQWNFQNYSIILILRPQGNILI
jgi:hypothetical protein